MDTLANPFRTQIHEAAAASLAAQRELAAFSSAQVALATGNTAKMIEMARTGFEAQVAASLSLSKLWVDSLAPKAD